MRHWTGAIESSTSGSSLKPLLAITEVERLIPSLEQYWKLQLALTVLPAFGAAKELPGGLAMQPNQVRPLCTTQWALQ